MSVRRSVRHTRVETMQKCRFWPILLSVPARTHLMAVYPALFYYCSVSTSPLVSPRKAKHKNKQVEQSLEIRCGLVHTCTSFFATILQIAIFLVLLHLHHLNVLPITLLLRFIPLSGLPIFSWLKSGGFFEMSTRVRLTDGRADTPTRTHLKTERDG